ncbi:FAD-binding domain-containing protein [Sphingomonas antarctica]
MAIALAMAGERPVIHERQRETGDAICGGFLSWRTLASLERLGVAVPGHAVDHVRVFAGEMTASAPLPGGAIGVSRRVLDRLMLLRAEAAGAGVERGVTVKAWDGAPMFLATGKHELRGLMRPKAAGDPTLGLRLRLPPHPSLARLIGGAIELHLFDRGYVGLVAQEDGSANLCLAVRKSRLAEADGNPATLLRQIGNGPLGERLAQADWSQPIDAIASVPYGWRATTTQAGVWRLGDQAACIPSLAGEGMGIAVASGIAAADFWTRGMDAEPFQRAFARRTSRPVGIAKLLWQAAENPRFAALGVRSIGVMPSLAALAAKVTRIGD